MKTIISKLESNVFSGVLLKKGKNTISDKAYKTLLLDVDFCSFVTLGYIDVAGANLTNLKSAAADIKPDFNSMNYQELLKYVKANNIKVGSTKKADILAILNK